MSNLPNISITHTFNGDVSAANKVNASDLDTQLGNLAANDNLQKSVIDKITNGNNELAYQSVGYVNLKPELQTALASPTGWQPKQQVACATTAAISLSGEQTIDGITTNVSRVLVKNQSDQTTNGIYVSSSGSWSRASDADTGDELNYAVVMVSAGATYVSSTWVVTSNNITIGTTAIVWANIIAADQVSTSISAGLSVRGVSGNTPSSVADIVAASDGDVVRRSGASVGFGSIGANSIIDNSITNTELSQVNTSTIKGRISSGVGNLEDLTTAQVTSMLNTMTGDSGSGGAKGLVPSPAAGDATKALMGSGVYGKFPFFAAIENSTPIVVTGATTATINRAHVISGTSADYTIQLPTAAGVSGSVLLFRVLDYTSATKQYTLDGSGSETIDGTTTLVLIHTNSIMLISDGTNWFSISKSLNTPWVDGGTITVTATTTNPTKGTTTRDKAWWRRVGDSMEVRYEYRQSAAGVAGSGVYLFAIPNGCSADTSKVVSDTETSRPYGGESNLGSFSYSDTSNTMAGQAILHSATTVKGGVTWDANNGVFGIAATFASATVSTFSASYTVPISGW